MKIGDVNVLNTLLQLERDVKVLQQFVEFLAAKNRDLVYPSPSDIRDFQQKALDQMKIKYPNTGIQST